MESLVFTYFLSISEVKTQGHGLSARLVAAAVQRQVELCWRSNESGGIALPQTCQSSSGVREPSSSLPGQLCQRGNNIQDLVSGKAEQLHQGSKGVFALLVKGPQHTHQNLLHVGSAPGAVATPHLPRDHRGPDSPLGAAVGSFQARTL